MSALLTYYRAILRRSSGVVLAAASLLLGTAGTQAQTVSANFAGRSGTTRVVPSGMFSVTGTGDSLADAGAIRTFTTAGLTQTRFWISLSQIYATSTPNFGSLDAMLERMRAAGVHPLGVIYNTPRSLGSSSCAAPSNVWRWGQMAASVVAHVDRSFPGLMEDYEIWNEPELASSLCISNATTRLRTYVSMFAAASSAMHAQAQQDGRPIRTGGPVISQLSQASTWIPALLDNSSTAGYVDFVSFHLYVTGLSDIQRGMNWSRLYSITQSNSQGLAHYYNMIESLVRSGHQPNAGSTPIYITEFNDNWAFSVECCRNDPTYGPLWNSLAIADFLNVVYSGSSAVPSQITYFNAVGRDFCLMGRWDSGMDCNSSVLEPYPQFYAFALFASPDYLDLQNGGHMAASVTPASTSSGLEATAFYTQIADNVVVINPTSASYNRITVNVNNPGLSTGAATVYVLNRANGRIGKESTVLQRTGSGFSAVVDVPAYSTVAVSVKGANAQSSAPPSAALTVTPQTGTHPLRITADSRDSDGGSSPIVGRTTNFGDGTWASWQSTPAHTYTSSGTYRVTVTVKNQSGQIATASRTVTVR